MIYIMVTHWNGHWDKIKETRYSISMLKNGLKPEEVEKNENVKTIFLKKDKKGGRNEKAWIGQVKRVRRDNNKIRFDVEIERVIDVPPDFADYEEGWYRDDRSLEEILSRTLSQRGTISRTTNFGSYLQNDALYCPPFFYVLYNTNDGSEFERFVHKLLRLLGVNAYHFENQKGHPDGFFKFGHLAVIYDATLQHDFMPTKSQQIENYCNMMKEGIIEYENNKVNVTNDNKQVWIITRGNSRIMRKKDDITVKEVSITQLIQLYLERLNGSMDEDKFEDLLRNIENLPNL